MEQLILHLFGDFFLQNDWMASNKRRAGDEGLRACLAHCLVYSIPFFMVGNFIHVLFIFLAHLIVDRFGLAALWCEKFEVGARLPEGHWLKIYLMFMVDMFMHLACNYMILKIKTP